MQGNDYKAKGKLQIEGQNRKRERDWAQNQIKNNYLLEQLN